MFGKGILDHLFEYLSAKIGLQNHIHINCRAFIFREIIDEVQVSVEADILQAFSYPNQLLLCWRFSFQACFIYVVLEFVQSPIAEEVFPTDDLSEQLVQNWVPFALKLQFLEVNRELGSLPHMLLERIESLEPHH